MTDFTKEYAMRVTLDIRGTYEMRRFLWKSGFRIYVFDGAVQEIDRLYEDYRLDHEVISLMGENLVFKCLYNGDKLPDFEILQKLEETHGVRGYNVERREF